MACTIGWIKTKDGFLLFKNRDRKKEEPKGNYFHKDKDVITFEDKKYKGCWIGVNKYGIGVVSSAGPLADVPNDYQCVDECFEANKQVLLESKSLEEATNLYIEFFRGQKIGKSYNVIIGDKNKANIIELFLDKTNVKTSNKSIFRTNNFETMRQYNTIPQRTKRSELRLRTLKRLIGEGAEDAKGLIPILSYHSSEDNNENICRHDVSHTVGSAIMKVKEREVDICSLLNESPCKRKYKEETFSF